MESLGKIRNIDASLGKITGFFVRLQMQFHLSCHSIASSFFPFMIKVAAT